MRKIILLTNDDGIDSLGLQALRKELGKLTKVYCIAPSSPSSAVSKALTFHKPLRYNKVTFSDNNISYSTTGSPADNVLLGFHLLKKKPDLTVSGINYGDNTSIHSILTSGTCAAAFESAFNNVPAIAFSAAVKNEAQLINQQGINFEPMAKIAKKIVEYVLSIKWPKKLAFLNINFPTEVTEETEVYLTYPVLYKYDNYMVEKKDPRGLPYLWLWGERKKSFPEGSDAWAVLEKNAISLTAISFNLHTATKDITMLLEELRDNIKKTT